MAVHQTHIGTDRQLFVDDFWMDETDGVVRRLHTPERREPAIWTEHPWEVRLSAYNLVFHDGERWRMYYQCGGGLTTDYADANLCAYAESDDGISWKKPSLGLIEFEGSTDNNLVYAGPGAELAPFLDTNPDATEDQRYKAVVRSPAGEEMTRALYAMVSSDGLSWRRMSENPVLTDGPFDSHNVPFWDKRLGKYVIYARGVAGSGGPFKGGYRWIRRATSEDFLEWTPLVSIETGETPAEQLYTNAYTPYDRAPDTYLMFPSRLNLDHTPDPEWARAYSPGVSDIVFMSSRDGLNFDRSFKEAWIRPGTDQENWHERGLYVGSGIVPTSPEEMSIYGREHSRLPTTNLRRYSLRTDGFVSVSAGYREGEFVTWPLTFTGSALELNYSTSAVGSVQVEIQDAEGNPIPGYRLTDCPEKFGDEIEGVMSWKAGSGVGDLAGRAVRLRFVLKDADLYAFRFRA